MKICLVAFYTTYGDNSLSRLSDMFNIFEPLTEEIFIITENFSKDMGLGEKIHLINIKYSSNSRLMPVRVLRQLVAQLTISWHLLKLSRQVDLVFWGISAHVLTIPMILTKLMRKKTILYLAFKSSEVLTEKFGAGGLILPRIYKTLETMSYSLCSTIVANSTDLLGQPQLIKHKSKLYPVASPIRFIDSSRFKINESIKQRARRIGFVGRLSEEKGVFNLIKAIPSVLDWRGDCEFIIIGDGPQYKEIVEMVKKDNLSKAVKFTGWLPHDKLPDHLNEMQLLVLPSLTEGLPTIAMEAMACGTPILATSVGGVLELITDGKTGFILEDNSPQAIARGIIRALGYPNLDEVVRKAGDFIEREHSYEAATDRFRELLTGLIDANKTRDVPPSPG